MVKTLRDYLPDNVQGKVFRGTYNGRDVEYMVWRISSDIGNAMRIDFDNIPPEISVCLLSWCNVGERMQVAPHLNDSLVREEPPKWAVEELEQANRLFAPDTREIEKVRRLLAA